MPNILSDARSRAYIKIELLCARPHQVSMIEKEQIQSPRTGSVRVGAAPLPQSRFDEACSGLAIRMRP